MSIYQEEMKFWQYESLWVKFQESEISERKAKAGAGLIDYLEAGEAKHNIAIEGS